MADQAITLSAPVISPEVLAFAKARGVDQYLAAVIDVAQRAFPRSVLRVSVDEDVEDETYQYIALDVEFGDMPVEELLASHRMWSGAVGHVCPSRYAVYFVLDAARLDPVRTQITDTMKVYERDVLKDVTWHL